MYREIDLDLSVKWADRNIGANSPEDSGLYFQWGDTVGYSKEQIGVDKEFTWNDYKWGTEENPTKYNDSDGKTVLDLEDDAAYVLMGGDWRLPTKEDIEELFSLEKKFVCQTRSSKLDEWEDPVDYSSDRIKSLFNNKTVKFNSIGNWIEETSTTKICGIKFIGKNKNKLYIPTVGYCCMNHLAYYGNLFLLGSSSLYSLDSHMWYGYLNCEGGSEVFVGDRSFGLSLRGVRL